MPPSSLAPTDRPPPAPRAPQAQRRIHNGHSNGPAAAAGRRAAVVWFRNDLRLHDNQALASANAEGTSVLPVYIFDPRDYGKVRCGVGIMTSNRHG